MKSHTKIFLFVTLDMQKSKIRNMEKLIAYVNGYFEEINENNYLTLVATNRSKERIKKYEVL